MKFNRNKFVDLCYFLKNNKSLKLSYEEIGEMLNVYLIHNNVYENNDIPYDDFEEFMNKLMLDNSNKHKYIKQIFNEFQLKISVNF